MFQRRRLHAITVSYAYRLGEGFVFIFSQEKEGKRERAVIEFM